MLMAMACVTIIKPHMGLIIVIAIIVPAHQAALIQMEIHLAVQVTDTTIPVDTMVEGIIGKSFG